MAKSGNSVILFPEAVVVDDPNITLRSRESEFRHWTSQLQSERQDSGHYGESAQAALTEAGQRLERLELALEQAKALGDRWQEKDPEIQRHMVQVRQAFMWLDAETDRSAATLG